MNGKSRRTANLFFIEMIIVLLFFCISCGIIMRVFAAAGLKAEKSRRDEHIILCAQSLAEAYSVSGNAEEAVRTVLDRNISGSGGEYIIYVDEHTVVTDNPSDIKLTLTETAEESECGVLSRLNISFSDGDEELYSLNCSAYTGSASE